MLDLPQTTPWINLAAACIGLLTAIFTFIGVRGSSRSKENPPKEAKGTSTPDSPAADSVFEWERYRFLFGVSAGGGMVLLMILMFPQFVDDPQSRPLTERRLDLAISSSCILVFIGLNIAFSHLVVRLFLRKFWR